MSHPTILITGGNDGIGKITARELARRGGRLLLACRSLERGEAAAADIRRQTGNGRIEVIPCDLADFGSIRQAATAVLSRIDRLDVLINNAGVYRTALQTTKQGFEQVFGVNHLGHFLLTHLLLDRLRAASAPRIVNVSSNAHYGGAIDFGNLRGERGAAAYDGWKAYQQSKLANVLFTRELARRFPGISSNCLHPGMVRARFANKDTRWYVNLGWTFLKPFMRSVEQGAQTSIYLAASPEVAGVSGAYFDEKQKQRRPSSRARDEALAGKLWEASEAAVGKR